MHDPYLTARLGAAWDANEGGGVGVAERVGPQDPEYWHRWIAYHRYTRGSNLLYGLPWAESVYQKRLALIARAAERRAARGLSGVGFLPALLTAVAPIAASAFGPKAPSGPNMEEIARIEADIRKRELAAQAAEGRIAAADTTRGKVLRYVLFGVAGAAALGALGLFFVSRRKNPRRSRSR